MKRMLLLLPIYLLTVLCLSACSNAEPVLENSTETTLLPTELSTEVPTEPPTTEHEHTFEDKVVAPTCTEKGYTLRACSTCDYRTSDTETAALGHSWSSWSTTKEATTANAGEKTRSCSTCGKTETETIPKIVTPQHQHSYKETVVSPTCNKDGYTNHTCSCGDSYKSNYVPALGHLFGSWKTVTQATTTATGTKECACSRCGHVKSEVIPKLDPATAEKYEHYIDPRIEIFVTGDGYVSYRYSDVKLFDTRTWGDPPSISITDEGGFQIMYYDKAGAEVHVSVAPISGYIHRCSILEDGTYVFCLTGDYKD